MAKDDRKGIRIFCVVSTAIIYSAIILVYFFADFGEYDTLGKFAFSIIMIPISAINLFRNWNAKSWDEVNMDLPIDSSNDKENNDGKKS